MCISIHDMTFKDYKQEVPNIEERLINDEMKRAAGDCICLVCNKKYQRHPVVKDYEWLNVLCDGSLVKL